MPVLTCQFTAQGPVIDMLVAVSGPRELALKKAGLPVPVPVPVRALVDTGASATCVDPLSVRSLGLTPTGTTMIHTPSTGQTPHFCNQYDAKIILVHPRMSFSITAMPIIEAALDGQGIQALVGRDILRRCLLVYDGQSSIMSLAF